MPYETTEGRRMSTHDPELVGLYWTISGPVEVHFGREWSLFDFADRCAHAQRVGFAGIGIWHADLEHVLQKRTLREMKEILDAHGLTRLELEFLGDWFLDPGTEGRAASDTTRALLWEAAAELGAHHVKVGNLAGTECPIEQVIERYGELCADAAQHHEALVPYEFMPFDATVNSIDTALALVDAVDAPNAGLVVDTWHMSKLGIAPEELRRIPLRALSWIELSDGRFADMDDRLDEVINHRELPGEGEFDIPGYVAVAQDMGYPGPWGVEVLSTPLRELPIEQIFDRAHQTTLAQFAATAKEHQ
jgi:sugar phosphate isomerase/epimerase